MLKTADLVDKRQILGLLLATDRSDRTSEACGVRACERHTCAAGWRLALLALLPLLALLVREVRLPLPHVPVKTLGQALEPVAHRVSDADGGEWVA